MIGIYKLVFEGTNQVYVGQSICIDKRYTNHICELRNNISSEKLQKAFIQFGKPKLEILELCSLEELDIRERYYIARYNSVKEGFNTTPGGFNNFGERASTSKHSKETYMEILFYLANTTLSVLEIASITDTTKSVVSHISDLSRHSWLSEASPEDYTKLVYLRNTGRKSCSLAKGKTYPKIVSPEGKVFEVLNTRKFSEEHSIPNGSLCGVLNGRQKYIKGWHLETTPPIPKGTEIKDPIGNIHVVPYRGAPTFSIEHNLCKAGLRELLRGDIKSHKGWTLA